MASLKQQLTGIITCVWLATAPVWAEDCGRAGQLFDDGRRATDKGDWQAAQGYLRQATALCSTYRNWYGLGEVERKLKHYPEAEQAFRNAKIQLDAPLEQQPMVLALIAESQAEQGETFKAARGIQEARFLQSNNTNGAEEVTKWMADVAFAIDQQIANENHSVDDIKRALSLAPSKSVTALLAVKGSYIVRPTAADIGSLLSADACTASQNPALSHPQYQVKLNFEFDSVELTQGTAFNLKRAATAMISPEYASSRYLLLGHTDQTGDCVYNRDLSMRRALAMKNELLKLQPALINRMEVVGMGEAMLLFPGNKQSHWAANRRLEILRIN